MENTSTKNCITCEFNMGGVCGEKEYGKPLEEMLVKYPNGCDLYGISLDEFIEQEKLKKSNI